MSVCLSCHSAVRVPNTQYVADDVSKLNSDRISAGICENWREREKGAAVGPKWDTGRIVPVSDSPFRLISSRFSYRNPDRNKKKNTFYSSVSSISPFAPPSLPFSFFSDLN